ncbi:Uma2 family endonuclease [Streptomyces sp. NPDC001537]
MDRLRTGLARAEEALPGFRVEIVEGSVVASPVTPHHGRTIRDVWSCLEGQIGQDWALISGVGVSFDDDNEFCPDLAVIPAPEAERNESAYLPDLVELVVEVVSRGSVRRDYETKPRWYASRGIANYLVLDPLAGHCVTMWNPGPDGYRGRDTVPYGPRLTVGSPLGELQLTTDRLPGAPGSRPQP